MVFQTLPSLSAVNPMSSCADLQMSGLMYW